MEPRNQGGGAVTEGVNHYIYDKSRHSSVAGYPEIKKKITRVENGYFSE